MTHDPFSMTSIKRNDDRFKEAYERHDGTAAGLLGELAQDDIYIVDLNDWKALRDLVRKLEHFFDVKYENS